MNTATLADPRSPVAARRPLHVVILDEELPYPPTSGKRIRTLNLTRRLASRHRLTYLCHRNANPREAEEARSHFAELGIETVIVERTVPPRSGPRFYARLAANLLSRLPYSVASHNSRALRRFERAVHRLLFKWLNRRSQRRSFSWERFCRYLGRHPLPRPGRLVQLNPVW